MSDETNDPERRGADDSPGKDDCFAPPAEPCECYCLHCQRTFMSDGIWFQKVIGDKHLDGFWMCPTANCDGKGFTFDIFPTDPSHPANEGWHECDYDEEDFDEEGNPIDPAEREYDPDEPKFKALDEEYDEEDDDDIEGEEWKYGLIPGEAAPEPEWAEKARKEWEEEQKKYDQPDQRPRILDWTGREDRQGESQLNEDDIPF